MSNTYFEDKIFEAINFSEDGMIKGEYEACTFINCNFSTMGLDDIQFIDCLFRNCDLSMVKMAKTVLNNAKFSHCKMLGINFENCSEFLFLPAFEDCTLNFSSFYKRSLKNASFKNCSLQEVDFTEADLHGLVLDNCELMGAKFENTLLEKADLRTSRQYSIDPEKNRIKKAKFSMDGIAGLLDKYDILIQ